MAIKKGDRVQFYFGGMLKHGTVTRGGKIPYARVDGTAVIINGPLAAFARSTQPVPKDEPSIMDRWGVSKFKDYGNGQETSAIEATITLNDKPVIFARNNGCGGCNIYHRIEANSGDVLDLFRADAKAWGKQFGYPYDFETEDAWLLWAACEKPYGILAADYFKNWG